MTWMCLLGVALLLAGLWMPAALAFGLFLWSLT